MIGMDVWSFLTSLSLGIALAAATGMRIFLPLFLAGLVIRFEFFSLNPEVLASQSWLGSNTALLCFGFATITEALAYKIPILDHFLDVVGAPVALVAGSVLATSFLVGVDDPTLKYGLGIVAGAGTAGIVHGTSAVARVLSTKTTAGIANPVFSFTEFMGALVTSITAFIAPIIGVIFISVAVIFGLALIRRSVKNKQPQSSP
jgi:hypothetical protein